MVDAGPIDLAALIDVNSLAPDGGLLYTFLAFPTAELNEHGVPADIDAQRSIAAIQSAGVGVGIWVNPFNDGTA